MRENGVVVTVIGQIIAELADVWSEGSGLKIGKILQEEILSQTL